MRGKLCHPLVEHQRRTGSLGHPVGLSGFARTLCATAGYYGLPTATPFYFRYISQRRGICEEAYASLSRLASAVPRRAKHPRLECAAYAPRATAGPIRESLRRGGIGRRQGLTKTVQDAKKGQVGGARAVAAATAVGFFPPRLLGHLSLWG